MRILPLIINDFGRKIINYYISAFNYVNRIEICRRNDTMTIDFKCRVCQLNPQREDCLVKKKPLYRFQAVRKNFAKLCTAAKDARFLRSVLSITLCVAVFTMFMQAVPCLGSPAAEKDPESISGDPDSGQAWESGNDARSDLSGENSLPESETVSEAQTSRDPGIPQWYDPGALKVTTLLRHSAESSLYASGNPGRFLAMAFSGQSESGNSNERGADLRFRFHIPVV